ncbi:DEAD/DEAH box helicase [Aeromonas caviae]|jgi:hypothetical protein|uniref:DEAD/DEAH box helicase n=1 Tax=Aeromonas TaxID=642 RepID=UPI000CDBD255|nr:MULTISPECIES: DEAD/DEAH box helicase [Aeromonas]AUZ81362.1 helicase [Aeromonas sp. ASNIH1]EHA1064968.1 helicase [Aeromonas hydrophila]MBA8783838.1 DEAD/DEAH box helicase [Aeromonas caviae]MBA8787835.1 DEAD/DEAH box helicase [Aeromonas sp. TW 6]MBS4707932.1 DEAD/DEAH box helicase [Aeromonas caviae]
MPNPIVRNDPQTLHSTLKEAVVDALLTMVHSEVSGAGRHGKYLYGARPRLLLNSGFVLPQKNIEGADEVTSPIWISSHGLNFQVQTGVEGTISILPKFAAYVRVLPNEQDLARPGCRAVFRLQKEVTKSIKETIKKRLDDAWEKEKDSYPSKAKHPGWRTIREDIRKAVYAQRGIPENLLRLDTGEATEGNSIEDTPPAEGVVVPAEGAVPLNDDLFEPMVPPHKWLRLEINLPPLVFSPNEPLVRCQELANTHAALMNKLIADQLGVWAKSTDPETGGAFWAYRSDLTFRPSQYKKWSEVLELARKSSNTIPLPTIELGWNIELVSDWLNPSCKNVFIALENKSKEPRAKVDETDPAIFQVNLDVTLPKLLHRNLQLERVTPSYRFNAYLRYPAMGHNGGVEQVKPTVGDIVHMRTTWAPRYVQPRIVPTGGNKVERCVRELSKPEGLKRLAPIVEEMQAWLDGLPGRIDTAEGIDPKNVDAIAAEKQKFQEDLLRWKDEKNAIEAGIAILQESAAVWSARGSQKDPRAVVFEAWLAMNEAMANFMKQRFKTDTGQWRLFQLAFIVANIPALASRMPEFKGHYVANRDDTVTLLYFATGGGKSEAFFGLLVFNLLFDRLRGKHTGVTAMLRYPLRLLTIQQAQRCAKVLAQAELVRRQYNYGGDPLSIGFWVGSGGSPNRHSEKGVAAIPNIEDAPADEATENVLHDNDSKYLIAWRAWNKIPSCPFCGSKTALRLFPAHGGTIAHVCSNKDCAANHDGWQPLPFYICDEDIYDYAPSVLLGTVDKLALIGHAEGTIRRIYGMLGGAPWRDKETKRLRIPKSEELKDGPDSKGCIPLFPAYPHGLKLFLDPFPSLIIQDEAHLLDESLGTFAGLFESTLDAVFTHISRSLTGIVALTPGGQRRRAKVIAASATVAEPQRQLEHLYQREVPAMQFPHPGPSLYESFYASPQEPDAAEAERCQLPDPEQRARQARVYCAYMTNGKPHTATSVAILSTFHLCISRLFDDLVNGDDARRVSARDYLVECVSSGSLKTLHQQTLRDASFDDLMTVIDLHRIALTYVTNKKGGDQIMAAELEETRKRHMNSNVPLEGLDTKLITGSVEQGEVQAVVARAQERDEPGHEFSPLSKVLRSVIATSAISHGVDVEEFNSMFFAGMPSDIAEYIQASSRVGRTHIGFVVLVPTPQRRRDRYIVEVFDIFHRFLERMVQPAAIDRWAEKAIERVFPSLFQAYLLGVLPTRKVIELPDDEKKDAPSYGFIPNITSEYKDRRAAFSNEINTFIELAVGLRAGYMPPGTEHYKQKIDEMTTDLLKFWTSSAMHGSGPLKSYFDGQKDNMKRPMTSLRDVDQGGLIAMSPRDAKGKRQQAAEVLKAMNLIRHGVAESE